MPVFISFLRGINVGGNKIIKMDALVDVYKSLKFAGARSFLQSGNILFQAKASDRATLTSKIETAIEKKFGHRCDVIIRSADELRKVIEKSPYSPEHLESPDKMLVMFLSGNLDAATFKDFAKNYAGPERMWASQHEIYFFFPDGIGRSKLNTAGLLKKLDASGTGRNWNTVTKLNDLAREIGQSTVNDTPA